MMSLLPSYKKTSEVLKLHSDSRSVFEEYSDIKIWKDFMFNITNLSVLRQLQFSARPAGGAVVPQIDAVILQYYCILMVMIPPVCVWSSIIHRQVKVTNQLPPPGWGQRSESGSVFPLSWSSQAQPLSLSLCQSEAHSALSPSVWTPGNSLVPFRLRPLSLLQLLPYWLLSVVSKLWVRTLHTATRWIWGSARQ